MSPYADSATPLMPLSDGDSARYAAAIGVADSSESSTLSIGHSSVSRSSAGRGGQVGKKSQLDFEVQRAVKLAAASAARQKEVVDAAKRQAERRMRVAERTAGTESGREAEQRARKDLAARAARRREKEREEQMAAEAEAEAAARAAEESKSLAAVRAREAQERLKQRKKEEMEQLKVKEEMAQRQQEEERQQAMALAAEARERRELERERLRAGLKDVDRKPNPRKANTPAKGIA